MKTPYRSLSVQREKNLDRQSFNSHVYHVNRPLE